ncbi:MAG: PDZ domain-containing protein [Pirellulales bacterium]
MIHRKIVRSIACAVTWLIATVCAGWNTAQVRAQEPVRYSLSIPQPSAHYLQVELSIVPKKAEPVKLFLPVWTPGSYLVREYARHIDTLSAESDGKPIPIEKTAKNTWSVHSATTSPIHVRYRIYCNELTVRTNFIDSEFAMLAGAATFITGESHTTDPHVVEIHLPSQWKQSVTALEHPVDAPAGSYRAANFDELVDSPILLGNPDIHPFQAGGAQHLLVNVGGDPFWNGDKAAADCARITTEHQKMWGSVPYKQYIFFNIIAEGSGGLEHDNGTVLLTSRWHFRNDKNYKKWLGLVSHEFFHAWNVRRLRPRTLAAYDYHQEMNFEELWVAEGITSYYDDLALARTGLMKPTEYLTALGKQIEGLQSGPGRLSQSLTESSFDTWIKFYRPDENSGNTRVDYYNKGAIVGFLLDIEIRRRTNDAKSLDDGMRSLYLQYAGKGGYTNADVIRVASETAGADLSEWFRKAIYSKEELNYDDAFQWLGLQFKSKIAAAAERDKDVSNSASETESNRNESIWIGITLETKENRLHVARLSEGGPGFQAGLNAGDELIAIEGFRLTEPIEERLKQYTAGDSLRFTIARRGRLMELTVKTESRPADSWAIDISKQSDDKQRARLQSWLHGPVK